MCRAVAAHGWRLTLNLMDQPLAGIHVVLVEDHQDTRDLFEETLRLQGARVSAAGTARDAIGRLAHAHIVITDVMLPGEDGLWLLEQVQQLSPPIPVIALTGLAREHDQRIGASGFAGVLLKPVDPWDLCEEIVRVLNNVS